MTFAGKREIGQPLPPHTLQRLERAIAKGHVHGTPAGHNAGVAVQAELAGERARAVLHPPALVQALAHSRAARTQHAAYDAGIKVVENRVEYALWQIQEGGAGKGGFSACCGVFMAENCAQFSFALATQGAQRAGATALAPQHARHAANNNTTNNKQQQEAAAAAGG